MSVRRLHSVARFQVLRQFVPQPQLGRIRDSVEGPEGYDPSGILVDAVDTAGGSRITIAGGVGTATPAAGVSWSVPLRDVAGRPIGPIAATAMRLPVQFTAAARELAAWSGHGTPTGNAYWIGVVNAPMGPAARGVFWLCQNVASGQQRVASMRWTASPNTNTPLSGAADIKGVLGTSGALLGASGTTNDALYAGMAMPYEGTVSAATSVQVSDRMSLSAGDTLHLVWGCGGPAADTIEFAALVAALRTADLTSL